MGSRHWTRSFGQPWSSAGSLWGRVTSRLHLGWTTRFFHQDEEMLVLTHSDELSRTYAEDSGSPPDHITNKHTSADDPRINRSSPPLTISPQDKPTASSSTLRHGGPALKETRTTVIATGPRTITITSVVSSADGLWGKDTVAAGASQCCVRPEEEQERTSLADSCQSDTTTTALNPSPTITAWEAGWNVTNAIQGIFVLGLPFALVKSGYVGLVLLVLSAWVCNHTGRILVACLYEEEQSDGSGRGSKVRVRHSYQDVVEACCKDLWPRLGGWTVNIAQVIELLMTCTLYLVVSTSLLSDTFSEVAVPRSVCSLVSLMFLLPCLLLTDLRPVSTLSLLCSLAHILISLLVMLYCLSLSSRWSWSSLALPVDPEDFLVSVGVIIFSYTSQIFLPPLEGSMEDRGQFNTMLGWTHGAACIMKTMFALLAVLTWGAETSEVITDNLPSDLRPLVNLCLLAKALLSFPLPFYSAAEILQSCLQRDSAVVLFSSKHGGRSVSRAALLVRGALLMMSYLLALLVPRFSLLMGLTGSVTGAAMTLILPCLFHLRLRWRRLAVRERLVDVGILSLGVICSVSGLMCSAKRLLEGL